MPADLAKVKEIFVAILEMSATERVSYLDTACAGDTALRAEIEAMLQSHEHSGELLPHSPAAMLRDSGDTDADATAAFAPEPRGSATQLESGAVGAHDLTFLAPSSKPGHIGRLAHYEIAEVLGKGGFGIVLKAFDEKLRRVVAIKVLSPAYAANGSARARFIREAQSAAAVKNEHVVAIHSVHDDAQPPFLVMEIIDGISLQDKLDKKGPLSLKEILRIGLQTAEGLAAAHKQGLVHRDIKPANILLENGVERVKITDFGLARAVDDASVTQSGTVAGTPMYMSPEQAEGLAIDHRSDLFSLGTVLYAMCTGHSPFRGSGTHAVLKRVIDASPRPIREINNEIPGWMCDIVSKLHAKKPEDRFQTAKEVAELLGQRLSDVQAGRVIEQSAQRASRVSGGSESKPPPAYVGGSQIRRWVVAAGVAGTVLAIVAFFWLSGLFGTASNQSVLALEDGLHPNVKEIVVRQNNQQVVVLELSNDFRAELKPGTFQLEVICDPGYEVGEIGMDIKGGNGSSELVKPGLLRLNAGEEVYLRIKATKIPTLTNEPGWVQLFNGKDTSGWKSHSAMPSEWRVEEQQLVGRRGTLFSERGDYRDFHLRIEAKIEPDQTGLLHIHSAGVFFRAELGATRVIGASKFPSGYFATLITGDLEYSDAKANSSISTSRSPLNPPLTLETPWITQEIIVRGKRVIVRINGTEVCNHVDANNCYTAGHFALYATPALKIRSIAIKELPPEEPGWVQLFNGTDLNGWRTPAKSGTWVVENGQLIGKKGKAGMLISTRDDFTDFHLRAKVKVNAGGGSSIFFRGNAIPAEAKKPLGVSAPNGFGVDVGHGTSLLRTGTLLQHFHEDISPAIARQERDLVKPGEWCILEIITKGPRVTVIVNGTNTANVTDEKNAGGHIALTMTNHETEIAFEKLEIKEPPREEPGWVELFNGKDLSHWQALGADTAFAWNIEDHILVGRSKPAYKAGIHLKTVREFGPEFHLRAEVKASDAGGNPILVYAGGQPQGFRVHLNSSASYPTGTTVLYNKNFIIHRAPKDLVKPDEWYRLEIICYRNRLRVRLNDQSLGDTAVPGGIEKSGIIGLFCGNNSSIQIRKMEINPEIKTFPPEEPGWVQLFNGKDLKGWIVPAPGTGKGDWQVDTKLGQLVGRGPTPSYVFTERDDFADFHLKTEVTCTGGTDSGIFFRCGKELENAKFPAGYAAYTGYELPYKFGALLLTTPGNQKPQSLFNPQFGATISAFHPLEIIARGNRIIIKIDGKIVTDYTDDKVSYRKGRIALQVASSKDGGVVVFKRIEIKELSTE